MSDAANTDLPELPDDFGKEVLARFGHRGPGETSAAAMNTDVPGGLPTELVGQQEWGQGTSVDASAQFEDMAQQLARDIASGKVDSDGKPIEQSDGPDKPLPPPQPAGEVAPGETAPVVEGEAAPEGELAPPEPGTEQQPPTPTPAPEPEGGYVWDFLDPMTNAPAAQRYTDAEVQQALHLKGWADNLDDGLKQAFAAIEDGQAVPIPRVEFDRYYAWLQQQSTTQRDTDLNDLDADPTIVKMIQDQRNEIEQLRNQISQPVRPSPAENVDANLTGFAQRFDQGVVAYMQQNRMTNEEAQRLVNEAVQSGIIDHLNRQHSQWNSATGKLIAPADPAVVAREALNWAIFQNPQFHQTLVARQQQANPMQTITAPTGQPGQAGASAPSNVTPITAKKARASSLATAPSAAVTPVTRTVNDMTPQELVSGMAAFIDGAQAQ